MRNIGLLVFPEFNAMSLSAMTVFETANRKYGSDFYKIAVVSDQGGPVRTSMGFEVNTVKLDPTSHDTLIVAGSDHLFPYPAEFVQSLASYSGQRRRVAAMCTGAFALAEAGLLRGKRATTHWFYAAEFRRRFPDVKMDENRIFISDDGIWTSAGMSAGTDMVLAMVEDDLGPDMAKLIARILVMYNRRTGGQLQFSALLDLDPKTDRIQNVLTFARNHLADPLTVDQLARIANLSTRQFSRAFTSETGQTPAKAVERMRVEVARQMIESGRHPLEQIARETGFNDRERMRKAFLDLTGQPPQAMRRAIRTAK